MNQAHYNSKLGSDVDGDGTKARPFRTFERAVAAVDPEGTHTEQAGVVYATASAKPDDNKAARLITGAAIWLILFTLAIAAISVALDMRRTRDSVRQIEVDAVQRMAERHAENRRRQIQERMERSETNQQGE